MNHANIPPFRRDPMREIVIDKHLCTRCGQCAQACPSRLLHKKTASEYPAVVDHAGDSCIACHHCITICPSAAISVDGINSDQCEPLDKNAIPRFESIDTLVRMRRSIRRYTDEPLEKRVIEQLLNVVRWAPSAKNGLPVKWIVINDREKVKELAGLVVQWLATRLGMEKMSEAWSSGMDPIFRGAPCVILAYTDQTAIWPVVDTTIAVETLDLCVTAMRLGSCWAGFFVQAAQHDPNTKSWLGLDSTEIAQGALMIGHIAEEVYHKIPHRPELQVRWM